MAYTHSPRPVLWPAAASCVLAPFFAAVFIAGCSDNPVAHSDEAGAFGDPLAPYSMHDNPSSVQSLSPGFHWLKDFAVTANYSGVFDSDVHPTVLLLECAGGDCSNSSVLAVSGGGLPPVKLYGPVPGNREEHYRTTWETNQVVPNPANRHRVEVRVDEFLLASAEVHVVEHRHQLELVDGETYLGLVIGDELRIAFRIEKTLARLAAERGFHFGAAVNYDGAGGLYFPNNPRYRATLGREFNMLVGENIQKWFVIRRDGPDAAYRLQFGDEMLDFGEANGMIARGHTLGWHSGNPGWLDALQPGTTSREEAIALLEAHIKVVAGHWKGRIKDWDVTNEVIRDNATGPVGSPSDRRPAAGHVWERLIGPDWVDIAFQKAHEVDPEARLFYNDYSIEVPFSNKQNRVFFLVEDLVNRGVPIHGVGLQSHFSLASTPTEAQMIQSIERFAALGLVVQLTELDIGVPGAQQNEAGFAQQAAAYHRVVKACLEHPACDSVVTWGVDDGGSWRSAQRPLLFDAAFNAKPAYFAIRDLLAGH